MADKFQNPYDSYLLEASAGSGKTYQLTKRFMNLVGAGADPANILTITFTVKAAQEMRSRIIEEASYILSDQKYQSIFDANLKQFFSSYQESLSYKLAPPRTAIETAKKILASTQRLRISTLMHCFFHGLIVSHKKHHCL